MAFPTTHTTTTAPQETPAAGERKIFINTEYLRTFEGKLKLAHLVLSVVVFVSIMASDFPRITAANFISFVSMCCFWTSAVLLFLYIINAVAVLTVVPWGKLELGYTCLWTFFWFVAGCVAADYANKGAGDAYAVAAFFSFVAVIVFGFNTFLYYRRWREGALSSNPPPRTTTTTTTTNIGGTATVTTTNSSVQKY